MTFLPIKMIAVWAVTLLSNIALAQNTLNVVTTTGMIADLAKNIGGSQITVVSLMGTGVDPHLYKATQGDVSKLLKADLILYNGLHLEGKMQDIFNKLSKKKAVHALANGIDPMHLITSTAFGGQPDPHIWFDVQLWQQAAREVANVLIKEVPASATEIESNFQSYRQQLIELDHWVRLKIQRIPVEQRVLVTAHDAFGYFARAYGMAVESLQGVNTASEFGLHDLKKVRQVVIARNIKAVFIESSVPKKFIQSLQEGLIAQGYPIEIGGELFSDAMGRSGTKEGTYIGMVKHNVNTIVGALL